MKKIVRDRFTGEIVEYDDRPPEPIDPDDAYDAWKDEQANLGYGGSHGYWPTMGFGEY